MFQCAYFWTLSFTQDLRFEVLTNRSGRDARITGRHIVVLQQVFLSHHLLLPMLG